MKVVGLITEYNPFHNGHQYHIEQAKQVTGADYCIAVMSGNFVQRGVPAMLHKYQRTKMALRCGVDLVIELPVRYACASAEHFAYGAVSILNQLGIVDSLCFGSECGDINLLQEAATFLLSPPPVFEQYIKTYVKQGNTYPAARAMAMKHFLKDQQNPNAAPLSQVLTEPNNILGIEYMKALQYFGSSITPFTIQRISAHYHEEKLGVKSASLPEQAQQQQTISSATAIRKAITGPTNFTNMKFSVPEAVYEILEENYQKTYPVTEDNFLTQILYKLLAESTSELTKYSDITKDLAIRLKKTQEYYSSFAQLSDAVKTKNLTLTRINRAIIHLLLNLKEEEQKEYNQNGYAQYARVLGVLKDSSHLLRKAMKTSTIPVITKLSKANASLSPLGIRMLQEDVFASHLYHQAVYQKYGTELKNEYRQGIVLL